MLSQERCLLKAYDDLCAEGHLTPDMAQQTVLQSLQKLYVYLEQNNHRSSQGFLQRFFASKHPKELIKGCYIYGAVGRGKTVLMDLFYNHLSTARKKRIHFHAFMQDLQKQVHQKGKNTVEQVAQEFAASYDVICLDEFYVDHIGDAMLIVRFLGALFDKGVVVVLTTNCAPDDLYQNGFQRELFLPFIPKIKAHMLVLSLDGQQDYRQREKETFPHWLESGQGKMREIYFKLTNCEAAPQKLTIEKRHYYPQGWCASIIWFDFKDLCERPLGARDYLHLSAHYKTWCLSKVPYFDQQNTNAAKRFQHLIDVLYDQKCVLWMSAPALPHLLFEAAHYHDSYERTKSRLSEMLKG